MINQAWGNGDCLSLEDIESVYPDYTFNGMGEEKRNPIHTIIEEAKPKV